MSCGYFGEIGRYVMGCGSGGCSGIDIDTKTYFYILPKEISLENETVKFRVWKNGNKQDYDTKLSFKEIRKYQNGKCDTDKKEYFVCGIKINKNGGLEFTKKGKDHIKTSLEGGDKAWKKFKDLRKEIEEELEALNEQEAEAAEEEEDYDR